jgi:hypothetical protein
MFSVSDPPAFPLPYDLPPVKYQSTGELNFYLINLIFFLIRIFIDKPWVVDVAYKNQPDSHGNMWDPSD